ncbi:PLP-dependent aminotransferase family protein [Streptomyces nigrescens]|uniref:GntR family transcriptional regulator n=1 Tax=Streptomyces nigrescens TaxID=1920 RepID=A0A640TD61_STRNI|nr:PLP-dependent aminotransferase family protein [Streptomyces libani]WAT95826.1 PLP-dependent aminotransferase family protein [Streptomyces libani subsp. libani]GFE21104.1 GntR family transcriptional regulator [Streptomyces libani subsp. libani]GGV88966.1 GntR family transcriptional regulator [Streptomyces libani subsp. libani]
MDDYRVIAEELAAEIAAGRLRPGDRLPPLRRFARDRRIASSTAARVYRELSRRGLTVGEVGRGTFVRTAAPATEPALAEPGEARVDLELNFPVLPGQPALLAKSLGHLLRPDALAGALRPVGAVGTDVARQAAAAHLARGDWAPDPRQLLFAGNGRQAVAAAIAALVPAGERLGVEALTYPVVKGIAARLGVTLVPLAMDEHGPTPEALRTAPPLRAVYVQPALHNPLGHTMPAGRRTELADILRELDLYAIEDAIYGFLRHDLSPLAALAPERTVVIDSLSKRLAPGLSLGFLTVPDGATQDFATALRTGTWTASRFALDAATRWMADGTAAAVEEEKRADAAARQRIAAERLAGFRVRADPQAYHCWWELPDPWRADTFVAAAARHGIAVTPSGAFAIGPGHAPNAVRLALASPPLDVLAGALDVLAGLAQGAPEDTGAE